MANLRRTEEEKDDGELDGEEMDKETVKIFTCMLTNTPFSIDNKNYEARRRERHAVGPRQGAAVAGR